MLAAIDRFSNCKVDYPGGKRIRLKCALALSTLPITAELAKAWSLDLDKVFVLEMEFSPDYLNSLEKPTVTCGQAVSINHVRIKLCFHFCCHFSSIVPVCSLSFVPCVILLFVYEYFLQIFFFIREFDHECKQSMYI
jgi:hypothetical protein